MSRCDCVTIHEDMRRDTRKAWALLLDEYSGTGDLYNVECWVVPCGDRGSAGHRMKYPCNRMTLAWEFVTIVM